MVKFLKMSNAVLISLILIITMFANGCSRDDIPFMGNSEKSEKALKVYTEAIEELKNEEDFDLKLTTSVELKEISCSLSAFNSILKKVVNHRLGEVEDEVVKFSFKDGVLASDNTIVPKNIVQPVNSDINDYLFNGVTSSYIYSENDEHAVYFTIGEEAASIDEIMDVFEELKDEVGTDFGKYDIHKEYPEIDSLAKYHSNFIDIMSVAPRISNLMSANNNHEHSEDDSTRNYGDFGKTTKIENGTCHIGESEVTANIDDKGRMLNVIFKVPLSVDVNVRLLHNSFKAAVKFEICQTYEYSYPN
ncbi:MAG: hypothetical protein K2I14_06535 [Eubacterium sp.]|nr:hypothetical protein [Eubacterium sp.]